MWILSEIYTNLFGVVIERIDDELKIRRGSGRHCLRYDISRGSGRRIEREF